MEKYLLITFESTQFAIKTEKKLKNLSVDTIPTPRQLTASCGISIKASLDDIDDIELLMGDDYKKLNKFYEVTKIGREVTFKVI